MPPCPVISRPKHWLPGILLALCGSALLISWWLGIPARVHLERQPDPTAPACLLSTRECSQAGARIRLSTDTVRPLQPATITVHWPALVTGQPLELRLTGREMAMGTYKLRLEKQPQGHYQAQLMLPVCTSNAMTWIGTVSSAPSEQQPPLSISLRMNSK